MSEDERVLRLDALRMCMATKERYMECLYKLLLERYEKTGLEEWMAIIAQDYLYYDRKMRKAGMK